MESAGICEPGVTQEPFDNCEPPVLPTCSGTQNHKDKAVDETSPQLPLLVL